jgi:O-antigen ligase
MERLGADDRLPLRAATWSMISNASGERVFYGYGAGSYRWTSPVFIGQRPEFLDKKGQLRMRATHAHNDWLQSAVELGIAGWVACASLVLYLARRARSAFRRPRSNTSMILGSLALFFAHAIFDFFLFSPHLVLVALALAWLACLEREDEPSGAPAAAGSGQWPAWGK